MPPRARPRTRDRAPERDAVRQAAKAEAFVKQTQTEGLAVDVSTPEALERYVRAEEVRWRKVVKDGNITTD
jgi:tripartite-type tricarboxylate transporter receptor subunit TctC